MPRRQQVVPKTTPADIQALDDIGETLAEANAEKVRWTNKWKEQRAIMADAMKKHKRKVYECGGVRYELKAGEAKLKMKTLKEDEE